MDQRSSPKITAVFGVLGFLLSVPLAADELITLGSVAQSPAQEIALYQPLADYLAAHLGLSQGRVRVAGTIREMAGLLERGEVDLYIDSPFPALLAGRLSGAKPLLRRLKYGVAEYRSVIFVRRDSGLRTLQDLHGKVLAFQETYSSSGHLLPKAALLQEGIPLIDLPDLDAAVPPDQIGCVLSGDGETSLFWVLKGKVAAAALNENYYRKLAGSRLDELRVLYTTPVVPRNLVMSRGDLPVERVRAIEQALLRLHWDDDGKRLLAEFEETLRFEPFPEGAETVLRPVAGLLPFIEREIEP